MPGDRLGQIEEPAPGQQGEPEEHEPWGKVEHQITVGHPFQQPGPPLRWARLTDLVADQPPEMGLPGGRVGDAASGSVDVARRPTTIGPWPGGAGGSGRTGRPPAGPVHSGTHPAPAGGGRPARGRLRPVRMTASTGQTRRSMVQGSPLRIAPVGGEHAAPEGARIGTDEVGGHTVSAVRATRTQMPGQLQRQPPAHPVRGHGQPLGRHRVGRRIGSRTSATRPTSGSARSAE